MTKGTSKTEVLHKLKLVFTFILIIFECILLYGGGSEYFELYSYFSKNGHRLKTFTLNNGDRYVGFLSTYSKYYSTNNRSGWGRRRSGKWISSKIIDTPDYSDIFLNKKEPFIEKEEPYTVSYAGIEAFKWCMAFRPGFPILVIFIIVTFLLIVFLWVSPIELLKRTKGSKHYTFMRNIFVALISFVIGGFLFLTIVIIIRNAFVAGFIGSNISGYIVGKYFAITHLKEFEGLLSDLGVRYFKGSFEWFPAVKSWKRRFFRALVSSLAGILLTSLLSVLVGTNMIASFFGGLIGGNIVGNHFAKEDYKKLKEMYAELNIPHYNSD